MLHTKFRGHRPFGSGELKRQRLKRLFTKLAKNDQSDEAFLLTSTFWP